MTMTELDKELSEIVVKMLCPSDEMTVILRRKEHIPETQTIHYSVYDSTKAKFASQKRLDKEI